MSRFWICSYLVKARKLTRSSWTSVVAGLLLLAVGNCGGKVHKGSSVCEKYDLSMCLDGTGPCVPTIEECANLTTSNNEPLDEPHNYMLCFASWLTINNSQDQLLKKGCWMNDNKCYDQSQCIEERYSSSVFFCCCDGDLCNREYSHRPSKDSLEGKVEPVTDDVIRASDQQVTKTVLYSIVPIIGVGVVVVTLFFMWRRHQHHMGHIQLPTVDPSLAPTPSQSSLNLQLVELRARGRYGSLWKAQLPHKDEFKGSDSGKGLVMPFYMKYVAVKIFPLQDKQSWMAELDIYNLPHMKHENILRFIAPERREDTQITELWLITEFHEKGSLYDYLKGNSITWTQLCRIGESMTRGLAYLHDEIPAAYGLPAKPAIAHRDFKSKNVLLRSDLTACVADFGLALKFEPGKVFSETHPQVGTRRYMAPEVLEGAICFNLDSFLRIDMYACGLVIWELMSRCSITDGPMDDYRLPFEAEIGLQPTLEEMQTLVITQKIRPAINVAWRSHLGLAGLIATLDECWDQDSEARLSAGCVRERFGQLSRTVNSGGSITIGGGRDPPSDQPQQHELTTSPLLTHQYNLQQPTHPTSPLLTHHNQQQLPALPTSPLLTQHHQQHLTHPTSPLLTQPHNQQLPTHPTSPLLTHHHQQHQHNQLTSNTASSNLSSPTTNNISVTRESYHAEPATVELC